MGSKQRCVVPSRHGIFRVTRIFPSGRSASRSWAMGGRKRYRSARVGTSGRVPDDPARNPAATIRIKTVRTSGPPAPRRHERGTVNGVSTLEKMAEHTLSFPKTSALGVGCKAHEVDNLYVVDASFFPSSCAVNPALTIMANALRVGDHLWERLG